MTDAPPVNRLQFLLHLLLNDDRLLFPSALGIVDDHVLWERLETVWCWTCNQPTEHRIFFRWGYFAGRWIMCKKCKDIVVERE